MRKRCFFCGNFDPRFDNGCRALTGAVAPEDCFAFMTIAEARALDAKIAEEEKARKGESA